MPQLQTLILKDRKSTPVNHTFAPKGSTSGVAMVVESSGVPLGDSRVTLSERSSNGRCKTVLKFSFPVLVTEMINGVATPKIARTAYAEIDFNFADTSTLEERNDVVGMVASALEPSKTLINDLVVKNEGIW